VQAGGVPQLLQRDGMQHRRVALDHPAVDFLGEFLPETQEHAGEDGHQQPRHGERDGGGA